MYVLSFVFAQNSSYHLLGTTHDSKHRNYMYIAMTHIESKSFMATSKKLISNKIQYMFQSIHDRVLCRIQVTKLYFAPGFVIDVYFIRLFYGAAE